ncbi:MAG: PilZ domain-containing protein [Pseudomonadales bacterium]
MSNNTSERRHFSRIEFDGHCTISFNGEKYSADLVDICLTGALIHSDQDIDITPGHDAGISIELLGVQVRIELLAMLKSREQRMLHFQLENIDIDSIGHLRRLLELNLGDANLIERELHHLGEGIAHPKL